ncbi:MAG TPA: PDZ domain-containing protein [Gemmatales bacterium]|nr:PDZ domain-containing protein [Gemmatales bacterium]
MRNLTRLLFAIAGVFALALWAPAWQENGDTRLMSMPAIGPKHIAFVYSEDLWIANRDGSNPRRLTSDIGVESHPVFSPDGSTLAFSAQYDGNTDVFTIPVEGGTPKRLTTHPTADVVRGFTPDGKAILFSSNRHVYSSRHSQLFTVPLDGGMPTQLPIPWGFEASFSPDGEYIAYTPVRDATAQWKNYRGGTHSRIWVMNLKNYDVVEIAQPEGRCNDLDPNWVGNTIYFRSDRAGEYNVFTFNPENKQVKQVTRFTDFPVIDINCSRDMLIFEQAGYLWTLVPGQSTPERLKIRVTTDSPESRARFVSGSKYVRGVGISPSGARAVVEFRGEIVTVPAEKGDPRNLTNSTTIHERSPSWSPDGKTIAYFSDEGGEYQLVLHPAIGKGTPRKIKLEGSGFYFNPTWSRDSKKLLFTDNSQAIFWLDVEKGKVTKIVQPEHGRGRGLQVSSWSPDSKWVAFAQETPAKISQVWVYSLEKGESYPITDGLSEATEPVFDANGKYLYFLASNDTAMTKHGFSQSASDTRPPRWSLYVCVLRKDLPSPFVRESDEEKGPDAARRPRFPGAPPMDEEKKDEPKKDEDEPKKDEPKKDEPKKDDADKDEPKKDGPAAAGPGRRPDARFSIDLEGIDQRILSAPVPSGSLMNLQGGAANMVFMISRPEPTTGGRGPGMGGGTLQRFDIEARRVTTIQSNVGSYELTADGRKMLYSSSGDWFIANAGPVSGGAAPAPAAPTFGRGGRGGGGGPAPASDAAPSSSPGGPQRLNLNAVEVRIDPREEWAQILHEAWRINRDFFYDPNMHGADWPAVKKKYEVFLPHCTNSGDVYRVIRWMLSELAVGHSYTTVGERFTERRSVGGGLLGADYEVANGRYRFKKIYSGLNFTADLRSPLTAPGVNVKEGEYLLAVRGVDLKPPMEIFELFENTAGKSIELTVGPNPDGKDSRTVTVEPLATEMALRNREWVEGNLRKVEKATGGRVGYVYVPDTAGQGVAYFKRYFYPQIDKEALIIDERFNSGGQIADYYIDILRRPFASFWAPRHGVDWRSPSAAVHGPKVMIADEGAGSGGDMLPYMFKKFKLGPVVGKRTWGGLVGISGYPVLMDGGTVTAPGFAIWTPEEGFCVENEGVAPDYDVDMWPKDVLAGRDPQLEKAIELVMAALEKEPKRDVKRPAYPKRAIMPQR